MRKGHKTRDHINFGTLPTEVLPLYNDGISSRIPMSESNYGMTQEEYLKALYRN
jgi:hypothetical protein